MKDPLQHVREAAIDGRLHNVIYRQTQLEMMHGILASNFEQVRNAMAKSCSHSEAELALEYALSLDAVAQYHSLLDAKEALHEEYSLARCEDSPSRRDPIGIVYVTLGDFTRLYSIISTASAAFAAGNCVVFETGRATDHISEVLQRLFHPKIDPSILVFVSEQPPVVTLGSRVIYLHQDSQLAQDKSAASETAGKRQLISPVNSRTFALVDRTADVAAAAEALVTARFLFGGNSPYAPDIVAVHEAIKDRFLATVAQEHLRLASKLSCAQTKMSPDHKTDHQDDGHVVGELLSDRCADGIAESVLSSAKGSIYELKSRDPSIVGLKVKGSTMIVHAVRSLDDAINLTNDYDNLLALYVFADAGSAKYASQFVQSNVSFVNQVPIDMLVGPAVPSECLVNRTTRYPMTHLTAPHAEFITLRPIPDVLQRSLRDSGLGMLSQEIRILSGTLRPKNIPSVGGQIGFFEQGIITGLGIYGSAALLLAGTVGYLGMRCVGRRWL